MSDAVSRHGAAAPFAATLLAAAPLAALLWLSGSVSPVAALAAAALLALVILLAGQRLLEAAGAGDMPLAAAWVLGVFATSLAVYALAAGFGLRAATAFAVWAVFVGAVSFFPRPLAFASRPFDAGRLVSLLLCGVATLAWCRDSAEVPRILAQDGVLAAWTDQFIHGGVISQFGDPRAEVGQGIELAGLSAPFYHYASYMLPAVLAWPLDLPGLTLATSVWVPLGFFTLCAGAYALGAELAGRAGAVAALICLTLLPDAGSYGLHNHFFAYYWYVLAVPGASYGTGMILLSIAFLRRWLKAGPPRTLLAGACLVAGSCLIRVHLFALAFPAWLMSAALATRFVRNRKLAFCTAAAAAFALFVAAFYWLSPDAAPALRPFLDAAHNQFDKTAYDGFYQSLWDAHGPGIAMAAGVLLIFPACLGVFTLLYPVSVALVHRSRGLEAIDLVPPMLMVCYVLLMASAPVPPPPHGDPTELTQRPFVLLYAVIVIWTAAGFASWLAMQGSLRERRVWLPLLLLAALSATLILRYTVRDWRWTQIYRVADGLPQAAGFLRANARSGDAFAAQGLKLKPETTDLSIQVVALTGVPAYLARPYIPISAGGQRKEVATMRFEALEALGRENDASAALARLRQLGIQWYVVAEPDHRGPLWDRERRHAAFVDRALAVYAVPASR